MEAIIEYNDQQNGIVEEILADHLNEGESEKFDERTVAQIDVPKKRIEELAQNGIKVNCDTPKLITLLCNVAAEKGYDDIELCTDTADGIDIKNRNGAWGYISVKEDKAYFQHGQYTPSIDVNSEDLTKWVDAYLTGFDEFDEIC